VWRQASLGQCGVHQYSSDACNITCCITHATQRQLVAHHKHLLHTYHFLNPKSCCSATTHGRGITQAEISHTDRASHTCIVEATGSGANRRWHEKSHHTQSETSYPGITLMHGRRTTGCTQALCDYSGGGITHRTRGITPSFLFHILLNCTPVKVPVLPLIQQKGQLQPTDKLTYL